MIVIIIMIAIEDEDAGNDDTADDDNDGTCGGTVDNRGQLHHTSFKIKICFSSCSLLHLL